MATVTVASPGQHLGAGDLLAGMYKIFAGEVLTAFRKATVTMDKHIVRTITNGKSAAFPAMGRTTAAYLAPGANLDDIRTKILHNERIIPIDGLLTTSQVITDIEEAMMNYDIRSEYARLMGEALAMYADGAVLAEVIKLVEAGVENIPGLGKGRTIEVITAAAERGITAEMGLEVTKALLQIKKEMAENYVPANDRWVFVTPETYAALVMNLVNINRDYGGMGSIAEGNILKIAGFPIIETPHLIMGGASPTGVLQGAGHNVPATIGGQPKEQLLFIAMHRSAVGTVKLRDLAIEKARRAELQADMLVARYAMGHGGLRPESAWLGVWKKK